jgi:hypothetical protein
MSQRDKPRLALNNITAGVREREDANRTREAGHLDEIQGAVANTLNAFRDGVVGFIDWLDAALELRARRGRRLTPRGRHYSWCRCVTLPGKAFLQLIGDSLFDHVLNGIGKRR